MSDKPDGLTFDGLVALVREYKIAPPMSLRCHPSVVASLRNTVPEPEWPPRVYVPELGNIEVVATTDLPPGSWQLFRGDEVVAWGDPGV